MTLSSPPLSRYDESGREERSPSLLHSLNVFSLFLLSVRRRRRADERQRRHVPRGRLAPGGRPGQGAGRRRRPRDTRQTQTTGKSGCIFMNNLSSWEFGFDFDVVIKSASAAKFECISNAYLLPTLLSHRRRWHNETEVRLM